MNAPSGEAVRTCEFLIIGGGIAGASAAYELSAHGRTIVLEREEAPGYHSTGRSAAQFLESYGNLAVRRLAKASRPFFDDPPPDFAEHPLLTPRGALFIARKDQRARFDAALAETRTQVQSVYEMECSEAIALVSVLREDYLAAAFFEPNAMDIDIHAIHHGYLKGIATRGGEVVTDAELTRLVRTQGSWVAETRAGAFAAPVVVNAAGAWCDAVAELAGVRPIGLVPKRRTALTFDPPDGLDVTGWPLTIDIDEEFYFKPEAGRILASPADETPSPPCDAQPEEIDVALAVDRVHTATTLDVRRITHRWAGLRSFVADKTPVVGMDDEAEGFFWIAGQGGYGIMTSPAMARAATGLATNGRLPDDLIALGLTPADLSPGRLRATHTTLR